MARNRRLLLDALLLGLVGGLSAQLFTFVLDLCQSLFLVKIAGYHAPGLPDEGGVLREVVGVHGLWLIPVCTTLGGLISGLLVFSLAPEAEGHGTDSVVRAYHRASGFIRYRVSGIKLIASAITIGSGGAAGREGPTALITAGIGSMYATLSKRSSEDTRMIVLIGMAAGLSAIFRSPIGCSVFAMEVLYRDVEYESSALFYALVASLVAYVVNALFVGWQPLFQIPAGLAVSGIAEHAWYLVLGGAAGLMATMLPEVFYWVRDLFRRVPVPPHVKPALGGLGVGLIALVLPQVLGGGYGWIQEAIDGKLAVSLLLVLVFAKLAAFALTVSSGGSGGIFAPSLFVGAMLGGFLAKLCGQAPAAFVIVGMVAVFGAAARVPFATGLMVVEMTGGYQLLIPAAIGLTVSCAIQANLSQWLKYKTLYEAQVPTSSDSPVHYVEVVETALKLLSNREIPLCSSVECVSIVDLLESGIPLEFPDGKRLTAVNLDSNSPLVGKEAHPDFLADPYVEEDLIAVIRGGEVLIPHSGYRLLAGDKVLMVTRNNRDVPNDSTDRSSIAPK